MKIDINENEVARRRLTDYLCDFEQGIEDMFRATAVQIGMDPKNVSIEGTSTRNNFDLQCVVLLQKSDQISVKMIMDVIFVEAESVEEVPEVPVNFLTDPENGDIYGIVYMPYEDEVIKFTHRLLFNFEG